MRILISIGLMVSAWTLGGCLGGDSSLTGPSSGTDPAGSAIAYGSELRIIEPRTGAALVEGESYLVIALQEARDGPLQGRARLQYRTEDGDWTSASPDFPWERRQHEVTAEGAPFKGNGEIRLIVFENRAEDPFLVSEVVRVRAVRCQQVELASK